MTHPAPAETLNSKPLDDPPKISNLPSASPSHNSRVAGWLFAGGVAVALVAVMSIGCLGLGIWWFAASKKESHDVAAVDPKKDPPDRLDNRDREKPSPQDGQEHPSDPGPIIDRKHEDVAKKESQDKKKDLGSEERPRKTEPPEEPAEIKKEPLVKPKEPTRENLIQPIDLGNLQRSDRLNFDIPAVAANEPPTPEIWDGHTNHIRGISFTEDGHFVVSISGDVFEVKRPADYSIRVWDARRGKQVHKVEGFTEPLDGLSVSPGGRLAVFGNGGHWEGQKWIDPKTTDVRLFDILMKKEIFADGGTIAQKALPRFRGLGNSVFCSAFSPDRQVVTAGSNSSKVMAWKASKSDPVLNGNVSSNSGWLLGVYAVKYAPNGKKIVLCTDQTVWVMDTGSGKFLPPLASHKDHVFTVAVTITPTGRTLAVSGGGDRQPLNGGRFKTAAKDYAIRLWDLDQHVEVRRFKGHQQIVHGLAFRPKTRHFLSGSYDRTVRLWDWETGNLLRTYEGHTDEIRTIAVSPDGRSAVSAGNDCVIRYWQLPALAEDLVIHLEKNDTAKFEKAIKDMDLMGPDLKSGFGPLAKALSQDSPGMRPLIRKALLAYAELWRRKQVAPFSRSDMDSLVTILKADDADLQSFAMEVVLGLAPQAEQAIPSLISIARDHENPKILAGAIIALKRIGAKTDEALIAYEKRLAHPDARVKDSAALALLHLGPERLQTKRVIELMDTPNKELLAAAEKQLRQKLFGVSAKDLPELRQGLKNPVWEVQVAFVDAIGSLKQEGQEALPDLLPMLDSAHKAVSIQTSRALEGMGKAGGKAVPMLAKIVETREKSVAVAAVIALRKLDPANAVLKTKGFSLLIEDLNPEMSDLSNFLAKPLAGKSASTVLELGDAAIAPLINHLLIRNDPKKTIESRGLEATAARYMGYELLKEFAKQAKSTGDKKMTLALKKHELPLKAYWEPTEATMAKQAAGMSAETRQVYVRTAEAANQAYKAVSSLREP